MKGNIYELSRGGSRADLYKWRNVAKWLGKLILTCGARKTDMCSSSNSKVKIGDLFQKFHC